MEKLSNLSFGISFAIFNAGLVIASYFRIGFDIILVGGILSALASILLLINSKFKKLDTILILIAVLAIISSITLYTNNLPFDREFKIVSLTSFAILAFRHLSTNNFQGILKHPFLNHPLIKVSIALYIVSKIVKIMHLDYVYEIYNLMSVTFIIWAFLKFIRPQIKNVR